jgi:protein-disulfide isomerase
MAPTLTRRQTLIAALAASAMPTLGLAQGRPVEEMAMGAPDAPVTLVEYAMFTCPHCATFNQQVFPEIKADYIDTGKVRLVFREVYFNKPSLWAAMVARCAPAERYFGIVDVLFARQADWLDAPDEAGLVANLYSIGRQAGLTDAELDACMQDRAFAEALVAEYQKNQEADGIEATPTFLVNGEKVEFSSWDDLRARLDAALGA